MAGGSFSVARDGSFALNQTRPESPGEVAVGARGGGVRRITSLNDDLLANRQLGEVEEIWWDSSFDGRPIQGWIVKPPDFDPGRRYPLILEIHGGPVSNYGDRFSAEMQLLAAAGYVVLYANPRGSTSYGEEFADLLYHNYPGQDYDDLISGVDAVIERGYIDEDNLFVTGGSAGGIMTAWIVGKTDRFRAAVAQKPVVNWISKTLTADNWYGYYYSRYDGLPWENPEAYWEFSPISLVGNVNTPTMIITGEEDLRTPLSESYQMFHALKLRGIDTAVIRLPGASHDMSRRPSQLMAKIANIVRLVRQVPHGGGDELTLPDAHRTRTGPTRDPSNPGDSPMTDSGRALAGVRVIALEQYMSAPYCSLLLADAGAEVIKIERPGLGDPRRSIPPFVERSGVRMGVGFMAYNRNKKSLALNLKSDEGRDLYRALVAKSDVVVEKPAAGVRRPDGARIRGAVGGESGADLRGGVRLRAPAGKGGAVRRLAVVRRGRGGDGWRHAHDRLRRQAPVPLDLRDAGPLRGDGRGARRHDGALPAYRDGEGPVR